MLSELHKLFKLIWQKKYCRDYKSWKYFFYSDDYFLLFTKNIIKDFHITYREPFDAQENISILITMYLADEVDRLHSHTHIHTERWIQLITI